MRPIAIVKTSGRLCWDYGAVALGCERSSLLTRWCSGSVLLISAWHPGIESTHCIQHQQRNIQVQ